MQPQDTSIPKGQQNIMNELYNYRNIRDLLVKGFSERDLRALCFDVPGFRPVYDEISAKASRVEIADKLLEHAEKTLQIDALLALAKEHNPARYEKREPYYMSDSTPALQKQVVHFARQISTLQVEIGIMKELVNHAKRLEAARMDPILRRELMEEEVEMLDRKYELKAQHYARVIHLLRDRAVTEQTIERILLQLIVPDPFGDT